jgi:hypothetical protein
MGGSPFISTTERHPMHSLNHPVYASAVAAERVEAAQREAEASRLQHPPPVRRYAAYVAARVARRLDPSAARRAVA